MGIAEGGWCLTLNLCSPDLEFEAGQSKGSILPWGQLSVTKPSHFHEWDPQRLIHPSHPPPPYKSGQVPSDTQACDMSVPLDPSAPEQDCVPSDSTGHSLAPSHPQQAELPPLRHRRAGPL